MSAPAAAEPTTTAATVGTQLRGSRMTPSSQSASSSAAASVSSDRRRSRRSERASEGSTGTRAERRRRSTSLMSGRLLQSLLQLLDGAVDEDLGSALGAPQGARDLAVVHPEGEAHDQRLAAVVRQLRHPGQDLLQLLALLDE